MDETELIDELRITKVGDPLRKELEEAFYYFNALVHEDMGADRYRGACSFLSNAHMKKKQWKDIGWQAKNHS